MFCNHADHPALDRRTFLIASASGMGGLGRAASLSGAATPTAGRKIAKSTILIWLDGGASHIDTWDMKPAAPAQIRGEFPTIATSTSGITLCEHLPLLARQTQHLAIVQSATHALGNELQGPNNHASGYYHGLTAHPPDRSFFIGEARRSQPDDDPFIGSVVAAKRRLHPSLPQLVMLPRKFRVQDDTAGQYATVLGSDYDPMVVYGSRDQPPRFTVPTLELQAEVSPGRLIARRDLLDSLDRSHRKLDELAATNTFSKHQQRAFSLLYSPQTKSAFDIRREPVSTLRKYGAGVNAMSMLMARRLVEAGVPFVTVVWKKEDPELHKKTFCNGTGSWDTHGKNFVCLKEILLPNFDRMFAALLDDLHERGLLDDTLVVVNSEMGRKPRIGDSRLGGESGRDHWRQCMSVLLAGGGIRGGRLYGSSDRFAEYPRDKPVTPADLAKTIYYAMGIDNLDAVDRNGKPIRLLEEGRPIQELF